MSIRLIPERSTSVASLSYYDSSLLPHRPRFNPRPVHVGFVVDIVTLGEVVFHALKVFHVSIIPHYFTLK